MKIYFDETIIGKEGWIPFLDPILGICKGGNPDSTGFYAEEQRGDWTIKGKKILSYANIESCDYIVFPINFKIDYLPLLERQVQLGKQYNKKIIVFYYDDCEKKIGNLFDNIIVFRTSMNQFNTENEFSMPGFPHDLGEKYGIDYQNPGKKITIGYVGYKGYSSLGSYIIYVISLIKYLLLDKTFLGKIVYKIILYVSKKNRSLKNKIGNLLGKWGMIKEPEIVLNSFLYLFFCFNQGKIVRENIIKKIKKIGIDFMFIERKQLLKPGDNDNKKDYVNTIKNCTFPLVMRGDGNYSYRLSEVMSLGKIPLFIDTNCRLPFDDKIDYKKWFVWVPYKDIKKIQQYIDNYLTQHKDYLYEISQEIRKIYENYFILSSYYTKIVEQLMNV